MSNTIVLRGANTGNFGDRCTGWWTNTWNDTTVNNYLQAIKDDGCNAIRIMGTIRWWLENCMEVYNTGNDDCSQTHRYSIIRTIELAKAKGMWVVFSFWSIDTVGARAPGIQDYLPYPPSASTQNYPTIRDSDDFVELWAGDSETSEFLARFDDVDEEVTSDHVHNGNEPPPSVSEALNEYPNVIYELYNEPSGNNAGWSAVTQTCIDAIRARGDNHVILVQCGYCMSFFGGPNWYTTMKTAVAGRTHVVFSNHLYPGDGSMDEEFSYEEAEASMMAGVADPDYACNLPLADGYPVVLGEVGDGGNDTLVGYILDICNDNGISWFGWEYKNTGWSNMTDANVNTYAAGALFGDGDETMMLTVTDGALTDSTNGEPPEPSAIPVLHHHLSRMFRR